MPHHPKDAAVLAQSYDGEKTQPNQTKQQRKTQPTQPKMPPSTERGERGLSGAALVVLGGGSGDNPLVGAERKEN